MEEDDDANKSVKGLEWGEEGRGVVMHVGEGLVLVLFARLKMYFVAEEVASEMSIF